MKHLLLMLLLLTVACVGAPARQQPETGVDPPRHWSTAVVEDPPVDDWWNGFRDEHLDTLIRIALEQNRDLQAAVHRVDRAAAEARIAGADLKPGLGASASASRQRQNFIGLPIPGSSGTVLSTTSTRLGLSLDTSWEIDLWGRMRAGARAAVAELQAVESDLRGARLSIAGQTSKVWFALVEAAQQVELASSSAESFRDVAEQVRTRYVEGLRPAVDLRLALSNLAAAEALLERRRVQLDRTMRQLEVLLGRYPAGTLTERFPARGMPELPGPVPVGLPAELVARRPDLSSAERRLAAADERLRQARRSLYPRFSLTASGGTASDQLDDLLDGDFRVWSLLGNLTQPLFQGGRLRAGVERAAAGREELVAAYAGLALDAFREVESALAAEQHLLERKRHLAEAALQLGAARRLAEDRYRSGIGSYLLVLESQTRELAAESELLTLRRELLENRVDLHLALGGGFGGPAS